MPADPAVTAAEKRAALLKELLAEKSRLQVHAERQLDVALRSLEKLNSSPLGYSKFLKQLSRLGVLYGWDKAIYDFTVDALTTTEIDADDAKDTADSYKRFVDRRSANFIILSAADGHTVADLIETLPSGNPRLVLNTIHEYFHPNTIAGQQVAYTNFFNSTQATTNTTIVPWIAHVSRTAKLVRESGGKADEQAELTVLFKGLLPEFATIKTILMQNAAITLRGATKQIVDFARTENILELSKGSRGNHGKDNVFIADVKDNVQSWKEQRSRQPRPPMSADEKAKWIKSLNAIECVNWAKGNCRYGDECHRKHVGPKGSQKRNSQTSSLTDTTPPVTLPAAHLGHAQTTPAGCDLQYATSVLLITNHPNAQLRALLMWTSRSR